MAKIYPEMDINCRKICDEDIVLKPSKLFKVIGVGVAAGILVQIFFCLNVV